MTYKHVCHETVIHVANKSKWNTSSFYMKQLSICGKQQQMTNKHFWHETVIHMWQTTANGIQACLPWNSYPYVANNSKWHTRMFDMKQLSICGKQQPMTHEHFWRERVIHELQTTANDMQVFVTWNSYPYVANNSKWHTSIFNMKQLSIFGKLQQMTHEHVWHETVIHMWQTTATDTQICLAWNSYHMWQTTAIDIKVFLTWNSYPCGKQQQMPHKHV